MNKWIVWSLTLLWILPVAFSAEAVGRKRKKVPEKATVEPSKYDKLFKGKKVRDGERGLCDGASWVRRESVFGIIL